MGKVVYEDVVETDWKCTHCGHTNRGATGEGSGLVCTHCGDRKDATETYVLPTTDRVLTGKAAGYAKDGRNVTCPYCGKDTRTSESTCDHCGYERTPPSSKATVTAGTPSVSRSTATPTAEPVVDKTPVNWTVPSWSPPTPKVYRTWDDGEPDPGFEHETKDSLLPTIAKVFGAVVLLMLGAWGVAWCNTPNVTTAMITRTHWQRHETLTERHDYTDEGWRDVAASTRDVYQWGRCGERQDGTHDCNPYRCHPHEEDDPDRCTGGEPVECRCRMETEDYDCADVVDRATCTVAYQNNNNGTATRRTECETKRVCQHRPVRRCDSCPTRRVCEKRTAYDTCQRQCPTMRMWCGYRYHQWDTVRDVTVGGDDHNVRWPGLTPVGDLQRLSQDEAFSVSFRDTKDPTRTWVHVVRNEYDFRHYTTGQTWTVQWTRAGSFTPLHMTGGH